MKESSFNRFVAQGVSTEDVENFVQGTLADLYEQAKTLEVKGEIEKTENQRSLCIIINEEVSKIIKKYENQDIEVTPDHVRIVDNSNARIADIALGQFLPEMQLILLNEPANDAEFTYVVIHESIHFKSYGAMQVPLDINHPDAYYRSGWNVGSRNRLNTQTYFQLIDEAMTEKMTMEVFKTVTDKNPELLRIKKVTEDNIENGTLGYSLNEDVVYLDKKEGRGFTYVKPREALDTLIKKLFDKNSNKFKNHEEIFDLFLEGKFTGNILPIGKLIDKTFGKGTFKKLGESTYIDSQDGMIEFVNQL